MTEPSPAVCRRLAELRARREKAAADRAAFAERRRHGLKARHEAKLARLADGADNSDDQEVPTDKPQTEDAA